MGKIAWSKLTPRTPMYLVLFLTPWMGVLYALSSFIFKHHALFSGGKPWKKEFKADMPSQQPKLKEWERGVLNLVCFAILSGLATVLLLVRTI